MISIEEAQQIILSHTGLLGTEEVPLLHALHRVIAEDVHAPWDIPGADHSAMDGYTFAYDDVQGGSLEVCGFLPAGVAPTEPVSPGCAMKIMTGAPIPPGCDTVVPVEDVLEEGTTIRLRGMVKRGDHIRRRGEEVNAGDLVVASGSLLRPPEIGILSSLGKTTATVFRKARVAVLSTGDELLQPGSIPEPGKIINSNSTSIAAQLLEAGAEPLMLGIARDDLETTRRKISDGLQADLLVTTGGVSVGDRDFVRDALLDLGGEIKFWKVAMKPGKPVAFAMVRGKPVFALPGNPVAAMVAFEQFVRPALLTMMGHARILRPVVRGTLEEAIRNRGGRPHFVRVSVRLEAGRYRLATTGDQGSARLSSLTSGNGLVKLPPDAAIVAGSEVEVQLLDRHFEMGHP
ncbi:molybdenum cofactor synthesis domain protein [Geobacter metallireducens RCH3]|uniref:Molybdopterin molybdenumtransferase n=1 Tax=Geobacter metallireducens (strain ATCC 53774 / DSM 7210 / GS-15) TaxID=269799 RepID=Q39YU5_GEOMG|nr:gephyrin-like molybdotransferase Glp [Geobacter metallireducens]ABB30579.1 molybdopterin--molybdenum ligase [Geobacter metallireducens GS-15]EHP87966.1 molybdenum cofactor synthesis domain protein [Geobacter metallireducens RCH3]